jgi:hypothetical protein
LPRASFTRGGTAFRAAVVGAVAARAPWQGQPRIAGRAMARGCARRAGCRPCVGPARDGAAGVRHARRSPAQGPPSSPPPPAAAPRAPSTRASLISSRRASPVPAGKSPARPSRRRGQVEHHVAQRAQRSTPAAPSISRRVSMPSAPLPVR